MSYIALKPLRVQKLDANGKVIRDERGRPTIEQRMPGDPVPEAVTWMDAAIWEKRGYIERNKDVPMPRYKHVKPEFVHTTREKDGESAAAPAPSTAATSPEEALEELMSLTKADLVELADKIGVELERNAKKEEIARAILSKRLASA